MKDVLFHFKQQHVQGHVTDEGIQRVAHLLALALIRITRKYVVEMKSTYTCIDSRKCMHVETEAEHQQHDEWQTFPNFHTKNVSLGSKRPTSSKQVLLHNLVWNLVNLRASRVFQFLFFRPLQNVCARTTLNACADSCCAYVCMCIFCTDVCACDVCDLMHAQSKHFRISVAHLNACM
jgi:hypothetical protein